MHPHNYPHAYPPTVPVPQAPPSSPAARGTGTELTHVGSVSPWDTTPPLPTPPLRSTTPRYSPPSSASTNFSIASDRDGRSTSSTYGDSDSGRDRDRDRDREDGGGAVSTPPPFSPPLSVPRLTFNPNSNGSWLNSNTNTDADTAMININNNAGADPNEEPNDVRHRQPDAQPAMRVRGGCIPIPCPSCCVSPRFVYVHGVTQFS